MKRGRRLRGKKAPAIPAAPEDLNAVSRALYGLAQPNEPGATAQDNEPLEDPLRDWTENAEDEWLNERRARGEE